MKKFLKIITIVIVVLIVGILGYTYVSLNYYSPEDPEVEIDQTKLQYFQDSYEESRGAFRFQANKLRAKIDSVQLFSRNVPGKKDNDLTIDFCYVPAKKDARKLLILTSGTHGVEGYVGSAVQQMFMNEVLDVEMLDNVGILFVHAVNPFGFKYARRLTENNVDFNRNCDIENSIFSTENSGYNDLLEMLNPTGKANAESFKNKFFMLVVINKMLQKSKAVLRQAILQGQYQHKKGIYFGGFNFEPQLAILSEVFKSISADYETVFNIDLHTGYGERGTSHLFPNPIEDKKVKSTLENIFEGHDINWGDSDDFYVINGSFTDYIGKLLSDKFYLPMLLEYGTLNSQSTVGSIKSLHISVLENQGTQFGYKSVEDSIKIKNNYMQMFNPSSEMWRTKIMNDSKVILKQAIKNYADL